MTPLRAAKSVLGNYGNFHGRATRTEYLWWIVPNTLMFGGLVTAAVIFENVDKERGSWSDTISGLAQCGATILFLVGAMPTLALAGRRLRDAGFDPWTLLLLITLAFLPIGLICCVILLVLTLYPSRGVVGIEESEDSLQIRSGLNVPSGDLECDVVGSTKNVFRNYANFTGRATGTEFCHWTVLYTAVCVAMTIQTLIATAIIWENTNTVSSTAALLWISGPFVGFLVLTGFWILPHFNSNPCVSGTKCTGVRQCRH